MRRILIATALTVVSLAGAAGCSSSPEPTVKVDTSPEPVDDTLQAEPTGEPAPEADAVGTRANPAPAGSQVKMGAYAVSLGPTVQDATADVLAENEFNDPPAAGSVFVMVPVTATLEGAETGKASADLTVQFVGSDGITYVGCELNYIPGSLSDVGEMYTGATATGNACASVPAGAVAGGTWVVTETVSFDGAKVFFALQ